MHVRALVPGPLSALASRPGIDPMLVWADAVDPAWTRRPGDDGLWPLVVDDPSARPYRCRGATWPESALAHWLADHDAPPRRIRLGLPVLPQRPQPARPRPAGPPVNWPSSSGSLLLGVIDHGCPFAHGLLRRGRSGTRVLALWDQDTTDAAIAWPGAGTPRGAGPGYGTLLTRSRLEDVMAHNSVPGLDIVDEARCYEAVRYGALRHGFTHGSAVMGVLLDGPPPGVPRGDAGPIPSADLVFVQIPRDSVQDCSSAALERYVLDGLDGILACVGEDTRHVVVTVSDGTSRTTHDGRSLVETGIAERVEQLAGRNVTLQVVVAAGNSRDELRHAQFDPMPADTGAAVALEVQPDDEAPTFVTLRLPRLGAGLRVRLTAPDGTSVTARVGESRALAPGPVAPDVAALIVARPAQDAAPDEAALALVALHPTRRLHPAQPTAPAGRWRIGVHTEAETLEAVHLWISRSQTNATALPRGRQARFCDEDGRFDPARARRPLEADPQPPRSPIRRMGSLNGLATLPARQGLLVIGAAFDREGTATPHSAAGPSAGQGSQARAAPDYALPVDHSRNHPGLNAPGTRSTQRVRVSGSSFAAPQAAALLAEQGPGPGPSPGPVSRRYPDPVMGSGLRRRR